MNLNLSISLIRVLSFFFMFILVISSCGSKDLDQQNLVEPETTQDVVGTGLWRLDATKKRKQDSVSVWYTYEMELFFYDEDSILVNTISYKDYNQTTGLYSKRNEKRVLKNKERFSSITPTIDENYKLWDKKYGKIFVSNSKLNKQEEYEFKFNRNSDSWHLFKLEADSFDIKGLIIQKYIYSDQLLGKYPFKESMETYSYSDTLLVEMKRVYTKQDMQGEWRNSKKQMIIYKDGKEVEELIFDASLGEFYLKSRRETEYGVNQRTTNSYKYLRNGELEHKYRGVEKFDNDENLIKKTNHAFDKDLEAVNLPSVKVFHWENGLLLKETSTNRVIENTYDSKGRRTKQILKRKDTEDVDWVDYDEYIYRYEGDHDYYTIVDIYDKEGEITRTDLIKFDSNGNPIFRQAKTNSFSLDTEIEHDNAIDSKNVIWPHGLEEFETKLGPKSFKHNKAPLRKTFSLIKKEKKSVIYEVEYFYHKLK